MNRLPDPAAAFVDALYDGGSRGRSAEDLGAASGVHPQDARLWLRILRAAGAVEACGFEPRARGQSGQRPLLWRLAQAPAPIPATRSPTPC